VLYDDEIIAVKFTTIGLGSNNVLWLEIDDCIYLIYTLRNRVKKKSGECFVYKTTQRHLCSVLNCSKKHSIPCLLHANVCLPTVEQMHADQYEALTNCVQQCLHNYALHTQKRKCSPTPRAEFRPGKVRTYPGTSTNWGLHSLEP